MVTAKTKCQSCRQRKGQRVLKEPQTYTLFSWVPWRSVTSSAPFCKWRQLRTKEGERNDWRHGSYKRHYPGLKATLPLSDVFINMLSCFSLLLLSHLADRSQISHLGVSLREQSSSWDFLWWIGFTGLSDHPSSSFQHLIGLSIWVSLVGISPPTAQLLLWSYGPLHLMVY